MIITATLEDLNSGAIEHTDVECQNYAAELWPAASDHPGRNAVVGMAGEEVKERRDAGADRNASRWAVERSIGH